MDGKPLTPKQQRFVAEYLIDSDATKAAKRAGYSPYTAGQIGYKLVQKSSIRAALAAAGTAVLARVTVDAEWVAEGLVSTYFRATAAQQFAAANKALELLGKMQALFVERKEHSGPGGGPIQTEDGPDLSLLTVEELEALRELYGRAAARSLAAGGGLPAGAEEPGALRPSGVAAD
jgi:hypothetical protein